MAVMIICALTDSSTCDGDTILAAVEKRVEACNSVAEWTLTRYEGTGGQYLLIIQGTSSEGARDLAGAISAEPLPALKVTLWHSLDPLEPLQYLFP